MYQLKNINSRKSVPHNPEKNMKAAEDYFLLLLHTHVIYAAETVRKTATTANVTELDKLVIEKFTHFSRANESAPGSYEDGVFLYASEVLSLGLICTGFMMPFKRQMEIEYYGIGNLCLSF